VDGPCALFGRRLFTDLLDVTSDVAALDSAGLWAVVLPFSGPPVCARFASFRSVSAAVLAPVDGPALGPWSSSLSETEFGDGVAYIREAIAQGDVYQVNLTRRLSAAVAGGGASPGLWPLFTRLPVQSAYVSLPGLEVASASPERFLRRDGRAVESQPIKGTSAGLEAFLPKDTAENVMIVDLVRNDLGRVCEYGSITVPALCSVEPGPGLFHMVSTVRGVLRPRVGWPELLAATFPPGSVVGAPKLAALDAIAKLEPVERGVYCGALGWVDADRAQGDLHVAIRTFWHDRGSSEVHFGTGGGITWDSTAAGEWAETELKAARLLSSG
jgi:para-aminobenzoate synthetase component 1